MKFPLAFEKRIKEQLGAEYALFEKVFQETVPTSIRLNEKKNAASLPYEKVPLCASAYYLPQRPLFVADPLWHAGAYYVQEAGSMLLEMVFKQLHFSTSPLKVLDLCAAPGGKSTHLLSLLNDNDVLVANEVIAGRNSLLRENIIKWGYENVIITQNDPKDFQHLTGLFDLIVIDAPCSGEGLFRKEPEAMLEWSEQNAELCAARQQRIIADVLPALKQGGYLIYSTCTYNEAENEQQLLWMQQQHSLMTVDVPLDNSWGIKKDAYGGLHCWPQYLKSEGFFIAALQKTTTEKTTPPSKPTITVATKKDQQLLQDFITPTQTCTWIHHAQSFYFFPASQIDFLHLVFKHLYVKYFGVLAAQIKKNDVIPQAALAFNNAENAFYKVPLSLPQAIAFLQKNTIEIAIENGWHLLSYQSTPLGFIKSIHGRVNNYFPTEWRIRKILHEQDYWSFI